MEKLEPVKKFIEEYVEAEFETVTKRIDLDLPNEEYDPFYKNLLSFFHSKLKRGANDITGNWERTSNWCESKMIRESIEEAKGTHVKRELRQIEKYINPEWGRVYSRTKAQEIYVCSTTSPLKPVSEEKFNRLFLAKDSKGKFQIVLYDDRTRALDMTDVPYMADDMITSLGERELCELF